MQLLTRLLARFRAKHEQAAADMPSSPILPRLDTLKQQLATLAERQRFQFALDCAESVIGYYERWSAQQGEGDAAVLREALDYLTNHHEVDPARIQHYLDAVGSQIPHAEENDTVSSSGALDAGLALLKALDCALSGSVEDAYGAGLATITVYDITKDDRPVIMPATGYVTGADLMTQDLPTAAIQEWERQLALITRLAAPAI